MAGGRDPDRASRRAFKLREPPLLLPLPLPLPLPAEASRWRGGAPGGPLHPASGQPPGHLRTGPPGAGAAAAVTGP